MQADEGPLRHLLLVAVYKQVYHPGHHYLGATPLLAAGASWY
jgi:hypothetical protein